MKITLQDNFGVGEGRALIDGEYHACWIGIRFKDESQAPKQPEIEQKPVTNQTSQEKQPELPENEKSNKNEKQQTL